MDILEDKIVNTRKKHKCFACLETFPSGSKMQRQVIVDDGIGQIYTCQNCQELLNEYPDEFLYFNEFPEGCVQEFMTDNNLETYGGAKILLDKLKYDRIEFKKKVDLYNITHK